MRQTCHGLNDRSVSLQEQARSVALARGIIAHEPASFLRLREVVLEWAPGAPSHVGRSTHRVEARTSRDPEGHAGGGHRHHHAADATGCECNRHQRQGGVART
jgi:hypothetical protein